MVRTSCIPDCLKRSEHDEDVVSLFTIVEEKGVEDLDTQDWQKNLFLLTMSTKFVVHTLWTLGTLIGSAPP